MQRRSANPRPIRTAARILAVLVAVNRRGRATLTQVASDTGLPTPTALRLLRSLVGEDYLERDLADGRFQPTARVSLLSCGFDEEAWIAKTAKPLVEELGDLLRWPISLATPSGVRMSVRVNTDRSSPLAVRRYSIGFTVPMLGSSAGRVYLAYCEASQRAMLLDALRHSADDEDHIAREREKVRTLLAGIRRNGYAFHQIPRRVSDLITLGVPVLTGERIVACIVIRFARSAVPDSTALRVFLPAMQATAARIGAAVPI